MGECLDVDGLTLRCGRVTEANGRVAWPRITSTLGGITGLEWAVLASFWRGSRSAASLMGRGVLVRFGALSKAVNTTRTVPQYGTSVTPSQSIPMYLWGSRIPVREGPLHRVAHRRVAQRAVEDIWPSLSDIATGKIAVKVINDYGDQVKRVYDVA